MENSINNFIFKRSNKLNIMNQSEHTSFFSTSDYNELSFFCNVLTDYVIRIDEIKDLLKDYIRSQNYYGILNENYSLLDDFESKYLVEIDQIENSDFNPVTKTLTNKPLNLETRCIYNFDRNKLITKYPYKIDFSNNKIIFNNWSSTVRKNTNYSISIRRRNVKIVYQINNFEFNDNKLEITFSEKINDIFGDINLSSENLTDIGILLNCGPNYEGINKDKTFSAVSLGNNLYNKRELFTESLLEDIKTGMEVSGEGILEGTFIESVEFKNNSSVMSTFIKLNQDIMTDNYNNISLSISTSFELLEYQQIYAPLVIQGSNSSKFNDTSLSKTDIDLEMDLLVLYDKESNVDYINWNYQNDNKTNLLTFNYDISSNLLDSKGENFDTNFILSLEYDNEIKNVLIYKLVDNGNSSYSINLENKDYYDVSGLKKIILYFLPNVIDEFTVSSDQLANITYSSDNIISSLFAKNPIKSVVGNYYNNFQDNIYKFNSKEDIAYLKFIKKIIFSDYLILLILILIYQQIKIKFNLII